MVSRRVEGENTTGEDALRAIDKVLSDKPKKIGHDFSEALRRLTGFREQVIAQYRAGPPDDAARERLARLNAVITVIVAGEYPLGKLPWPHVEKARDSFAALLQEFREEGLR